MGRKQAKYITEMAKGPKKSTGMDRYSDDSTISMAE